MRPHLEYAIQATCPYLKKDVDYVERVQRLATSKVKGMKDLSYAERLSELGLQTLEHRRFRGDLIVAFSIYKGRYDLPFEEFFSFATLSNLRGHSLKLLRGKFRLNRRGSAFAVRVVAAWNRLPQYVIDAPSVATFQQRLDGCWQTVFGVYILSFCS